MSERPDDKAATEQAATRRLHGPDVPRRVGIATEGLETRVREARAGEAGQDATRPPAIESTATEPARRDGSDPAALWLELVKSRAQPWANLAPGTIVGGFRIVRHLGSGGMGVVYLARDVELQRNVAVKVHLGTTGIERLQREAMAMAQLAHPNIVTIYAVGRYEGQAYVAMEYIPGTTLHGWLQDAERSWRDVLALMLAAGEALAFAHSAGFVHRDIKPGNILVGEDGRPRLVDFGLVHVPGDAPLPESGDHPAIDSSDMIALTVTGEVLGTPAYMAPEQLAGLIVDGRADQFAFCLAFYEALYGKRPWQASTAAELRRLMTTEPPATPPRGKVPTWLWHVLRRGLDRDPARRYPSMRALLGALRHPPRTRALLAAAPLVLVVAAVGGWRWRSAAAVDPCDAAAASVAGIWTPDARRAMAGRFRLVDPANGAEVADRLAGRLDRWTERWRRTAAGACHAAARGRSPVTASAAERCLHASTTRLRSLVSRATTASTPDVMADLLEDGENRLPWVEECNDEARLATVWGTASAPAARPNPTDGYWVGNFGRLALREVGDEIWGVYDHDDGTIRGTLVGDSFVGWWCEVPSRRADVDAGEIELRFATDAQGDRRIDGKWRYGSAGAWDPHWDSVWSSDEAPADLRARFADTGQFCRRP